MTFTGRTGTALLVAVIVSLCLNLLLGGLLIGGRWHDGHGRHWRSSESFLTRVPEEARPVVKGVFDAHKADFDAHRKQIEEARQKVAELMKADVIDRAQLDVALAELQQRTQTMQQFGHQVMIEVAEKLPPEIRREMADRWAKDRFRKKPDSE